MVWDECVEERDGGWEKAHVAVFDALSLLGRARLEE